MYATCLFCNNALGANQALEQFPVGRRLAFDATKGRLWVICAKCQRWNLSPLETRWEAIEEAERAFRGTKLRVSTDNIGLARLSEGLELVRIGAPQRPEFAAWRYGDQFGKRRRKAVVLGVGIVGASLIPTTISVLNKFGVSGLMIPGAALSAVSLGTTGISQYVLWKNKLVPSIALRDEHGASLRLTQANALNATILPNGRAQEWQLTVPHVRLRRAVGWSRIFGHRMLAGSENRPAVITGEAAIRALATVLPAINHGGGKKAVVSDAVGVLSESTDLGHILRGSAVRDGNSNKYFRLTSELTTIRHFPAHIRLAMEMSVHEDDERRAMEGELMELEQRWKDADGIAKIADEMFLPAHIEAEMDQLRVNASSINRSQPHHGVTRESRDAFEE